MIPLVNYFKKGHLFVFLLILVVVRPDAEAAIQIYGPPQSATILDGNALFTPFDEASPARFQQVYNASIFEPLTEAGGGWIRQIIFRVDANLGHPFITTIPSVQINISTTDRAADGLSAVFDDNVGLDNTLVLGPTAVRISGLGGGGITGFDVLFDIRSNPFYYNPAGGNLLLDFHIFQGIGPTGPPGSAFPSQGTVILDAFDIAGDPVSSVFAFGSTLPAVGQPSSLGLATDFVVTPIPESSTSVLLTIALGTLVLRWKRTGKE